MAAFEDARASARTRRADLHGRYLAHVFYSTRQLDFLETFTAGALQSFRSPSQSVSLQRRLELNAKARWCRHNPTTSELLLWQALKSKQLGVSFRRQVVLLNRFIVDFYASQPRLVVEIDGGYHVERQRADARRDALLQRAGYRVLRLSDECVTGQLPLAIARIRERIR